MKRKIFAILFALVLAVSLMMVPAALVGANPDVVWSIGEFDDSRLEFKHSSFSGLNEAIYNVGVDTSSDFPAFLYVSGYTGNWEGAGVHKVTINFSLDKDYQDVTLKYRKAGAEWDEVSLDGGTPQTVKGPGENIFKTFVLSLGTLSTGLHSIVIECVDKGGADGAHSYDALELNAPATCPECTTPEYLETVTVPANGATVPSLGVLESGVTYLFKASGTYTYWPTAPSPYGIADAEYSYRPASSYGPGWVLGDDVFPPTYPAYSLDINVDGSNVDWGDYNPAHVYTMLFDGTGSTADFRIYDDVYGDNSGSLKVEIYECKVVPLDHFLGYKVKTTKVCDGGVTELTLLNNGPAGDITVTTKDGVVFSGSVASGEEFNFGEEGVKLGTSITITVYGVSETTIHTSCSQPIYPDLVFDAFTVVEGASLKGGPLETLAPKFEPGEVTLTDQFGTGVFKVEKPDKFYNPADKEIVPGEADFADVADVETHLMGYKVKLIQYDSEPACVPCKGGLTSLTLRNDGPDASILVTAGKENEVLFHDFVQSGYLFSFSGTGKDGKLDKDITITVDGEETTIHTSCSQPIGTGQTFGDFTVVAGESKDGGPLCPIITVESQFGTIFVTIDKPDRLLVPTAKSLTGLVDPLELTCVDHFLGYKIKAPKVPKDTPELLVTLVDQFGQPKEYDVKKPTRLFVPVDKDGLERKNPEAHLICYTIKPAKDQPKHINVLGIYTNNQFGPLKLNTDKEEELLVPCQKIVPLNLYGDWLLSFDWEKPSPPAPVTYDHGMTIDAQNADGTFSGTGGYPLGGYTKTWTVSGDVTGNVVSMTVTYDSPSTFVATLSGTIAADGNSMNGSFSGSGPNFPSGTWTATRK